jgi:hypothetical protein
MLAGLAAIDSLIFVRLNEAYIGLIEFFWLLKNRRFFFMIDL